MMGVHRVVETVVEKTRWSSGECDASAAGLVRSAGDDEL